MAEKNNRIGLDEDDADQVFAELLKEAKTSKSVKKPKPLEKYEPPPPKEQD